MAINRHLGGYAMAECTVKKRIRAGPFPDNFLNVIFILMLLTMLFGKSCMNTVARILGLGPGWPELLQGGFGFLFLMFLGIRAFQLAMRRNAAGKGAN